MGAVFHTCAGVGAVFHTCAKGRKGALFHTLAAGDRLMYELSASRASSSLLARRLLSFSTAANI